MTLQLDRLDHLSAKAFEGFVVRKDLVRRYIESRGGTPDLPERRWEEFEKLLSSPRLPSNLQ